MNKLYMLLLLLPLFMASSCSSDDDDTTVPTIKPEATGTMTDARDGYTYHWVRFGGLDWTVENSHFDTDDENCTIYTTDQKLGQEEGDNDILTLKVYGYLYTLAGAQEAVPDGWRLPTDEDYQKLEQALGMTAEEVIADGWRGSYQTTLLRQGDEGTGLKFLYGGMNDANSSSFASHCLWMSALGYYWTATTADNESVAYMRKIQYNSGQVWRHTSKVNNFYSVRFVRDAQ